jgi:16S rRNA (uracil1498-N3)-methyltransferase
MMQSGQNWLPELKAPQRIENFLSQIQPGMTDFFIAHCMDKPKEDLLSRLQNASRHRSIMIGPEGDFTEDELHAAIEKGAVAVSLGSSRLRAETAGVVAATLLNLVKPPLL